VVGDQEPDDRREDGRTVSPYQAKWRSNANAVLKPSRSMTENLVASVNEKSLSVLRPDGSLVRLCDHQFDGLECLGTRVEHAYPEPEPVDGIWLPALDRVVEETHVTIEAP
jgi:hypothetical protein